MDEFSSPDEIAWNSALRLLEAGDKSRYELKDRLLRKRFKPEVVETVLARLEDRGFLNDKVFANRLADKLVGRKASQRKMAFEMRRRGVPPEYIQDELTRLAPDEDERLYEAGVKQWKRLSRVDPKIRIQRIYGTLARQGFDADPIRRVLDRIKQDEINQSDESSYVDNE